MAEFTNLGKGEEIVLQAKVHWARLIGPSIIALIVLLAFASSSFITGLLLAAIIVFLAAIPMWTEQLVITNKRLYGKTGLIKTKTLDTPLNKVNTVSVSSGLGGKIFGYGQVHVTSSSGSYVYTAIASPDFFRQTLMEEIERYDETRVKKQAEEMARAMRG